MTEHSDEARSDGRRPSADDAPASPSADPDEGESGSTAERVLTLVGIAITVALLAYVVWQVATLGAPAAPTATIDGIAQTSDGRSVVTVKVENPGSAGLISAVVEVVCANGTRTVTVEHVPADAAEKVEVVCEVGPEGRTAEVVAWIRA